MKKKRFKQNNKKWRVIDSTIIVVLFVGVLLFAFINALSNGGESFLLSLWATLFLGVISCMPIIMLYLAFRTAAKNNERKNVVFDAVDNIDYYRDNLGELSPGLISLMMNLDIEDSKDITAMLLYFQSKKIINVENETIKINESYDTSTLKGSDLAFLNWIKTRQYTYLQQWKNLVEKEAYQNGYIKAQNNNKITGCLLPIIVELVIIILLVILGISLFNENTVFILETELVKIPENISFLGQLKYIFSIGSVIIIIIKLILFILLFIALGYIPIFKIVYFITSNLSKKRVQRTKLGNQLTERIYAMKNFIHDFGTFSRATKEHLVLWDYFLIYAVVLEENEEIVNEISRYKNINMKQFTIDKTNKER